MVSVRGLAYPLQVLNGSLKLSEDVDCIRDSILSVLETRSNGERTWRQQYGTPDFVFETAEHPQAIVSRIQVALEEQIPDVVFQLSGSINESGIFSVLIGWVIADGQPQPPIGLELNFS